MNPFSARAASSSLHSDPNPPFPSKWARPLALTSGLTKNLIRSGLKFNHSLKELILGAIGGWCPLHLIVAQLLPGPACQFRRIFRLYRTSFFPLLTLLAKPSALFRATIGASPGNNLLCIDIKPCYLIELPSSFRLKRRGWQHFLAWAESKGSLPWPGHPPE